MTLICGVAAEAESFRTMTNRPNNDTSRDKIPLLGMIDYGEKHLSQEGFVAMPLGESYSLDPLRSRPHYHDFFQVTLFDGDGQLMHDFREIEVSGSTLFFLSPGQVHTIVPTSNATGTIVSFTREFCDQGGGFLLDLPFFFANARSPWISIGPEHHEWVAGIFGELQEEYIGGKAGAAEVFRALLSILFVRTARWHAEENPVSDNSRGAILVRKFEQSLERNYLEWTALTDYARDLGVTMNHLNDQVREKTGESAGTQIRHRRLLDAKRQLLHSTMTISEIGYRLGFEDPSYFSRFFRRYEKMTPMAFREKIREKYQKGHN